MNIDRIRTDSGYRAWIRSVHAAGIEQLSARQIIKAEGKDGQFSSSLLYSGEVFSIPKWLSACPAAWTVLVAAYLLKNRDMMSSGVTMQIWQDEKRPHSRKTGLLVFRQLRMPARGRAAGDTLLCHEF